MANYSRIVYFITDICQVIVAEVWMSRAG